MKLAGYEILSELGRGGMGVVYRARHLALGREVALKVLHSACVDDEQLARFRREIRLSSVTTHPGLVQIYDGGVVDDLPYLVMELVSGGSLESRLGENGLLSPPEAARIGATVAAGLAELHRTGIVHRDVKPANILLTPENHPKLADFGVARGDYSTLLTQPGTLLGTVHYLPPEAFAGLPASDAFDVWALGCVLYRMFTGKLPFEQGAQSRADWVAGIQFAPIIPVQRLAPEVPLDHARLVATLLDQRPGHRPTAADAARILSEERPSRRPSFWAQKIDRRQEFAVAPRRNPVHLLGMVLGVALVCVLFSSWPRTPAGPLRATRELIDWVGWRGAEEILRKRWRAGDPVAAYQLGHFLIMEERLAEAWKCMVEAQKTGPPVIAALARAHLDLLNADGPAHLAGLEQVTRMAGATADERLLLYTRLATSRRPCQQVRTWLEEHCPDWFEVKLVRAFEEQAADRPAVAQKIVQSLVKTYAASSATILLQAELLCDWGFRTEAEAKLLLLVKREPNSCKLWMELGSVERKLCRPTVEERFRRAIACAPAAALPRLVLAGYYFERHRRAEALELCREAEGLASTLSEQIQMALVLQSGVGVAVGLAQLERAEAAHPGAFGLLDARGKILRIGRQYTRAAAAFAAASRLHPSDPECLLNQARCLENDRRWTEAEAVYRRVLAMRPELEHAICGLANVLEASGRADEATKVLTEFVERASGSGIAIRQLGTLLIGRGQTSAFASLLKKLTERFPDQFTPRVMKAELLLTEKRQHEAVSLLKELRKSDGSFGIQGKLTWALVALERFEEAEKEARLEVQEYPDQPMSHAHLGQILLQRRQSVAAAAEYREALKSEGEPWQWHIGYATCLFKLRQEREALQELDRAVARAGGIDEARYHRMGQLASRGYSELAVEELNQIRQFLPEHSALLLCLLQSLRDKGMDKLALSACTVAVRHFPRSASLFAQLGLINHQLGRWKGAVEAYRTALRLDPTHDGSRVALAGSLNWLGNTTEAEEVLVPMLERAGVRADVLKFLGDLALKNGHRRRAIQAYQKTLQLQPNLTSARRGLLEATILERGAGAH
jgi:tetratricopeptide (TPR) repeat protein